MKKLVYSLISLSIIFFTSCGGEETTKTDTDVATTEEIVEVEEVTEEVVAEETTEEGGDIEAGKELYASSGCVACHQLDVKTVGPSVKEVSTAYADNKDGLTAFLKGEAEPIIDPAQAAVMTPQLEVTKKLADADLQNMVEYILSNK